MKKTTFIFIIILSLVGCSTAPPTQVLTSINSYYYYTDRFTEKCPSYDSTVCPELSLQKDILAAWYKRIKEANSAINRGGDLPLQLKALKDVEKKFKKGAKDGW